jgi:hypothetical protein
MNKNHGRTRARSFAFSVSKFPLKQYVLKKKFTAGSKKEEKTRLCTGTYSTYLAVKISSKTWWFSGT